MLTLTVEEDTDTDDTSEDKSYDADDNEVVDFKVSAATHRLVTTSLTDFSHVWYGIAKHAHPGFLVRAITLALIGECQLALAISFLSIVVEAL